MQSQPSLFRYLLLAGLITALVSGCAANAAATPAPTAQATTNSALPTAAPGTITANGVVQPYRTVTLSFGVAGRVAAVNARVGDALAAGQPVAALDPAALQNAVAQAELNLAQAQAQLTLLEAQAAPRPTAELAATAAVTSAQAALTQARIQAGKRGDQLTLDQLELTQAERARNDAQAAYNSIIADPNLREWAPTSQWGRALNDAQAVYDAALARYRLTAADYGYSAAIAAAEAQLAQAQNALYAVQHPVLPAELTLAQLAVANAELTLATARAELARTDLNAPFAGVVADVLIDTGEWVGASTPVLTLVDVSRWRIETRNVGELQIGRVQIGQSAQVRVNAFRDTVLVGRVVAISPVAVVQQGDTTYTLTIELDATDLNLRPGMNAQVEIVTE